MSNQIGLDILLRALLNAKGFEDLQAELKKASAAHKEAAGSANEFQSAIQGLGSQMVAQLAQFIAIGAAIAFIKGSITAAVKESRTLDQFDAANRRLGVSTAEGTAKMHEWLRALEDASGISKNELIPAYGKLSEITTTTAATQGLLQLAAGAAARGLGDINTISTTLARTLLSPTGAAKATGEFGLLIKKLREEGKSTEEILKVLTARFGDAGRDVHNAGIEIDRMRVANERAKAALGETGATLLTELAPALRVAMTAIAMVEAGVIKVVGAFKSMGSTMGGLFEAINRAMHGDFIGAIEAWKKGWAEGDKALAASGAKATEVIEHVTSGFDRSSEALKQGNQKMIADILAGLEKPKAAVRDIAKEYDNAALHAKTLSETVIGGLAAEIVIYQKMAADPAVRKILGQEGVDKAIEKVSTLRKQFAAQVAHEAEEEIKEEKEKQKAIKKTNDDWLAGETAKLALERKDRDLEAKEAVKAYQILHKNDLNYAAEFAAFMAQQVATFKGSEAEMVRLKLEADAAMNQSEAFKAQFANAAVNGAINALGDYFGASKEIAVAQAIISTYQGAALALATYEYPYDLIVAAAVIAEGLADVAMISGAAPKSASKGSSSFTGPQGGYGFDNPSSDYAAYIGGQKWAGDMVRNYSSGAEAGWSAGMARGGNRSSSVSNVTNRGGDRTVHNNVTFNGIMSADQVSLMKFTKTHLTPVLNNLDRRRELR